MITNIDDTEIDNHLDTSLKITGKIAKQITSQVNNQLNTGIIVINASFNIVTWNRFLEVHGDKSSASVLGHSIFKIFSELPERWLTRKFSAVLELNTPSFCSWQQRHHLFELPHTRPITTDSQFMAQNCTFLPIEIEGVVDHICILIEDVTDVCHYQGQLQKALDELALMSRIDGLTQIYNRRHWQDSLEQEYAKARRHNKVLTLIMFDLDHFKLLNDTYGHQGGDKVLIDVSKNVKALLRIGDVFGRYGGEEFAIVLPETNEQGAMELAERICQAIANTPLNFQQKVINISVSIGVSSLNEDDGSYEDLIANADLALYQAKAKGRNQVCLSLESKKKELLA